MNPINNEEPLKSLKGQRFSDEGISMEKPLAVSHYTGWKDRAEMRTRKTIQKVKGTIQVWENIIVKEWMYPDLGVTGSGYATDQAERFGANCLVFLSLGFFFGKWV